MKKVLLAMAVVLGTALSATDASAQAYNGVGDKKLQIGFSGWGYGQGITGTFDYGVHQYISLGVGAQFYFSPKYDNANMFVFGRANLHLNSLLNLPKALDIYPGLNIGYFNRTDKPFGIGGHLGIRYFFTPKIGIFGEFGNNGALGLSFNL